MTALLLMLLMRRHSHDMTADSAAVTLHVTATSVGAAPMRRATRRVAWALWSSSCLWQRRVKHVSHDTHIDAAQGDAPVKELERLLLAHPAPRLSHLQAALEGCAESAVVHENPRVEVEEKQLGSCGRARANVLKRLLVRVA